MSRACEKTIGRRIRIKWCAGASARRYRWRRAALRAEPEAVDLFLDPAHTAELNVKGEDALHDLGLVRADASSLPDRPASFRSVLCHSTVTSCRHRNPSEHGML